MQAAARDLHHFAALFSAAAAYKKKKRNYNNSNIKMPMPVYDLNSNLDPFMLKFAQIASLCDLTQK